MKHCHRAALAAGYGDAMATAVILLLALAGSLKNVNTAWLIVLGSGLGYLLWMV